MVIWIRIFTNSSVPIKRNGFFSISSIATNQSILEKIGLVQRRFVRLNETGDLVK